MLFILLFTLTFSPCSSQHQKFRVTPHDLQVREGAEAILRCEVTNQAGAVQWTKDGFALGFSSVIAGFPRYSVFGDRKSGIYNLRISNATITDDAEYQCQVGPARLNSAIRANAKLTVVSPPSSIQIQGYSDNSKVEVKENQDLTLKCTAANAKPEALIVWYRGNAEYNPEEREDTVEELTPKRFTTTSILKLKPGADDDYTEYSCEAKHKAISSALPMRAAVQLSVLYPPGPPYIEGYKHGNVLRRGQQVELICRSRGGNPPAQLIWYKNGSQIRMAYRTSGRLSENIYSFTAEANDNRARFRCEASNVMSQTPLKSEVELIVLFAPTHVNVTGATEARFGDIVPLTCTTAPSNPSAEIKWVVGGRQIRNATTQTVPGPEGGWITTSNITVRVEPNKRSVDVSCHGLNMKLPENAVSTHTINVLYAPSPPIISGYIEGQAIAVGSVHKLLCVSTGGNPIATLTWYKNNKRINSIKRTADKSASAEITIKANVSDNRAQYRCEAANTATQIPLSQSIMLSVHFAPTSVKTRIEPKELKPGTEAIMICDSNSSNPPAIISWWKDGVLLEGINSNSKPGLWGGSVSSLQLKVNITREMNGFVYTCESTNEALQRSVHESIILDVLYPPQFVPPPLSAFVGIEGEPMNVTILAHGNPKLISFTWKKDELVIPAAKNNYAEPTQRLFSDGASLNITKLNRKDAGLYICEASNAQGKTSMNLSLDVKFASAITVISENVVVNPGEDAKLSCTVDGNPLTTQYVKWERIGYDFSLKTSRTFTNRTSFLHIKDAQREDVGNFRCTANNGVGNPTSRDVLLLVHFAPEIDRTSNSLRAASGTGETGRLPCRVQASPKPTFIWRHDGEELLLNRTYKYITQEKTIDPLTYESILHVAKVAPADYGTYECFASNHLGQSAANVRLDITSPPETPLSLNILNVTHDTVTVAWTPAFDGGLKTSYRIRYREANRQNYKYIDGLPNSHKLNITDLKMNTLYEFSVMAFNDLGESNYIPDFQRTQTKEAPAAIRSASTVGAPPTASSSSSGDTSGKTLLFGIAAGLIFVAFNIVAIVYCIHKRNEKAFQRDESKQESAKPAAIEMYAPSSYNSRGIGETLSIVSEKSDSCSNDVSQPDYVDGTQLQTVSTHLDENEEIPSPRYQEDGILPTIYSNCMGTYSNPGQNIHIPSTSIEHRTHNDQMLLTNDEGVYISSLPSAPSSDGSYYNMSSDRYLSYHPINYLPQLDFTTSPLSMMNSRPISQGSNICESAIVNSGSDADGDTSPNIFIGMPSPDLTHHNIPNMCLIETPMLHDPHLFNIVPSISMNYQTWNYGGASIAPPMQTITKQPQSILKDSILHKQQKQLLKTSSPDIEMNVLQSTLGSFQILNIPTSMGSVAGLTNNFLISDYMTFDPTNLYVQANTFNYSETNPVCSDDDVDICNITDPNNIPEIIYSVDETTG